MAINQIPVALDICTRVVQASTQLLSALDTLENLQEQAVGAGINLADYEEQIAAGSGIQHCDPATYKNILEYFAPDAIAALKNDYNGSPTQQGWNALQKARA